MPALLSLVMLGISLACARSEATHGAVPAPTQTPSVPVPIRVQQFGYEVVNSYPHDPDAFTQGLLFYDGYLYESTGLEGRSSLRKVDVTTGEVLRRIPVDSQYFAEGLALFEGRLFQLTWLSRQGFVYGLDTFQMEQTFNYRGEGWGLTTDGRSLIMSDGSNQLRYLDPRNFDPRQEIQVVDGERPVNMLNELEYVDGQIYANIWQSDRVAIIQPETGKVVAWINLAGLLASPTVQRPLQRPVDVLNGIAYDAVGKRLFVTGKLWPRLFEIRLVSRRVTVTR